MPQIDPLLAFLQQKFPQTVDLTPGNQIVTPQLQKAMAMALGQPMRRPAFEGGMGGQR